MGQNKTYISKGVRCKTMSGGHVLTELINGEPAIKYSEESTQYISLALYDYLCKHIVGSEEVVKTKRLLTTITDNLNENKYSFHITSGTFGEGLEMKGSDFDFMHVIKDLQIYDSKSEIELDINKTYFEIKTDDTKLGFVKIKLLHSIYKDIINLCIEKNDYLLLSNIRFKSFFGNFTFPNKPEVIEVIHGPCLSDRDGRFDTAFCVHSRSWISQADQWVTRSGRSWPSNEVVSRITEHGTLFVPVGVKGSPEEEIEWRISFSVGEKFLIYSFTHTQLLCYVLLKLVLKDIINTDVRCKNLLCSYYLKNIIFWVSEEIPLFEWKPHNLIKCFMQCFKRLIYCVEYSVCPHYFIPENNMFENKIEGGNRLVLLEILYTLYNSHCRCLLLLSELREVFSFRLISTEGSQSFADYCEHILNSFPLLFSLSTANHNYSRAVKMVLSNRSANIQRYYYFCLSALCQRKAQYVQLSNDGRNKRVYRKYKTCQSYLFQGLFRDAVSGWLQLASLYYQMKLYKLTLTILAYSLSKCSPDKLGMTSNLSSLQRHILDSKIFQNSGLVRVLQLLRLETVYFIENSPLVPFELAMRVPNQIHFIPPVVFAHFLSFLCHYHLRDVREYRNSLADLQLTLSEDYFIVNSNEKSISYIILGIILQMTGDSESAREAFRQSVAVDQRLFRSHMTDYQI